MAAQQFLVPGNHATVRGLVAPNATASLYTSGTLTPQPFYSDSGLSVSLGSTITADAIGVFPLAYQDNATGFRIIFKDATGATLDGGDIDPFVFGQTITTVTGSASVATRSALAALAGSSSSGGIYLKESGREGMFVWSSANNAANVTADPQQGIYVAPASDTTGASGAWVRKFSILAFSTWWGVATGNTAAQNVTAFQAALNTLKAQKIVAYGYGNGSIGLHTPAGTYQFNASLNVSHGLAIGGDYNGQGEDGTNFVWTSLSHGFDVAYSAIGYTIRGLLLRGAYAGTEGNYHAINTLAKGQHIDLFMDHWPGNAFYALGNSPTSNINGALFQNIFSQLCQWTIHVQGGDANGCAGYNISAISNRRGNIYDQSFLGNYWAGGFVESCGNQAGFLSQCVVSGHVYVVRYGQETWCSTNAPSGSTASNTGWLYLEEGAASATQPTWTTGLTWYWSAALASQPDNNNMYSRFTGFYIETNCCPVILSSYSTCNLIFPGRPVWTIDGKNHAGYMRPQADAYMEFNAGLYAHGNITAVASGAYAGTIAAAGDVTAGNNAVASQGMKAGQGIRLEGDGGAAGYTSGPGLEAGYTGGKAYLQGIDRALLTYLPVQAWGSSFTVGIGSTTGGGTTDRLAVDSTGATVTGKVAATGLVTGSNLSGTNTGDQTITLTGNVTGSGTGSFATTIPAGTVTLAMQANMATASVVYRKTAGSGAPEVQTLATLKTDLGLTGTNSGDQTITLTGNVTGSGTGSFATTIAAGVVARAMMANTAAATVLGSTAAGAVAELTAAQGRTVLGLATVASSGLASDLTGTLAAAQMPALTGDVTTSSGAVATTLATNIVTYAKFQQVAASSLVGNATGSLANAAGITLAGGLAFSGSTLTAAGALTPTSVVSSGGVSGTTVSGSTSVLSTGTGGVGYAAGAGGTAAQSTGKSTTVSGTNKMCVDITLNGAALAASTTVSFTFTNTVIAATDNLIINHISVGTFGSYTFNGRCAAGSATIDVRNVSLGSLSEAIVIRVTVFKGANT